MPQIPPDEWKRRYVARIMDRLGVPKEIASESFEAGDYSTEEMAENTPEEMADEELSNWDGDEGDLDET